MITVRQLIDGASTPKKDGRWLPCLPYPTTYIVQRVKDAWEVFKGRAEAIIDGE